MYPANCCPKDKSGKSWLYVRFNSLNKKPDFELYMQGLSVWLLTSSTLVLKLHVINFRSVVCDSTLVKVHWYEQFLKVYFSYTNYTEQNLIQKIQVIAKKSQVFLHNYYSQRQLLFSLCYPFRTFLYLKSMYTYVYTQLYFLYKWQIFCVLNLQFLLLKVYT